jgi:glycosyltransferase involved in cell wall biosynthesis
MWPFRQRPLISVVIASYNHAPFVQSCLRSVLQQGIDNLEIIVTDDGSQDATAQLVAQLATQQAAKPASPQIHLQAFAQNQGACAAMNDAIRRARGQYIAVLNSDDQFLPGKLSRQVAFLEQNPEVGAVFGWPTFIDEHGAPFADATHKDHAVFHQPNRTRQQWLRHFFDHGNALCHPTAMLRREVYDTVGLYDPRLAQVPDLDQWIRVCMRYDIHVLPEPLTAFRIRDKLQNASAARPEVIIRDAWERARILRHYLTLSTADLAQVFPEFASQLGSSAEKLARHALTLPYPFFHRFALDAWFDALPSGGKPGHTQPPPDPSAWQRFIAATATVDLHRLMQPPTQGDQTSH